MSKNNSPTKKQGLQNRNSKKQTALKNSDKKGYGHIVIEFMRHEFLNLVAKALSFLFTNITAIYAAFLTFQTLWEFYSKKVGAYFLLHPDRLIISILILLFVTPYARGGLKAILKLANTSVLKLFDNTHSELEEQKKIAIVTEDGPVDLARFAGLSSFSDHKSQKDKNLDWGECKKNIASAKDLRIMGATGWATFGDVGTPLHDVVKKFKGELKILLLCNDASADVLLSRAAATNKDPTKYHLEIEKSLAMLRKLKIDFPKRTIEVKLYKKPLIWKMIICNSYMWLQHYWEIEDDVENTPVYTFYSDGGERKTSLFHPFYEEWKKQWEDADYYDLSQ